MAFSVSLTSELTIGAESKIEWDFVRTNIGGGYNPTTSEFVCPSDGTYFFNVDVATAYTSIIYFSQQLGDHSPL